MHPTVIKKPVGYAISGPLNKITLSQAEIDLKNNDPNPFFGREERTINPDILPPDFDNMPNDPGMQTEFGTISNSKGVIHNYNGQTSGSYPPDCNGDVGPVYYFQTVNVTYTIYNKNTGVAAANGNLNSIFNSSLPGAGFNNGDPIVLWDEQANRWLYVEFSIGSPPNYLENDYMLIAVSQTADPTGLWYSWSYDVDDTPDYMKFGIWQDGYYMATNTGGAGKNDIYVFERSVMLTGGASPQMIAFDNPNRPTTFDGFHCIMPCDNDGAWAPAGTPGTFVTVADDGQSNPADELRIYECVVDWVTPSNSTFAMTQQLPVNPFSGNFNSSWDNIPQPGGSSVKLDGISTVLMYRANYRNFSGTEKIVCAHTIAETSTEGAIRWYILERNGGNWAITQQSTYNPGGADGLSRWLPGIAMNGSGQVAMGFSTSDASSVYPGIKLVGRSQCAPNNTMDMSEITVATGGTSQSSYNRWGDYANMSVDPNDDYTFWFTTEYMNTSTSTKYTKIVAFTLDAACNAPTITNVSPDNLYEDRGKEITITGSDLLGCTFDIGGISGTVVSNNGTTAVVNFPAGNYTNGTLTVTNGAGSDTDNVTINTRNTIPVVIGATATSDNHPTILSAVTGLHAWYGTTAFNAGDLPGTKTIIVNVGTYTDEVTLNSGLNPTAANPLIIQNNSGDVVIIDATGNNYGFDLTTVDYVQLSGFTVESADLANIYAQGDNVTIFNNKTISSVGGSGIKVETGTPFTITNNLSYGNYKYGIEDLSAGNTIKNNTCDDNGHSLTGSQILTYTFTGSVATSDNTSIYGDITVPNNVTITNVRVINMNITHTYDADLDIYLRHPDGTEVELTTDNGGSSNNYENTTFDDASATSITSGSAPFTGTFSPEGNLSDLDGKTSNGTWRLRVYDDANGDDGTLTSWTLEITYTANSQVGAGIYVANVSATVENNIFVAKSGSNSYYALISPGNLVSSDYNTYFKNGNANTYDYNGNQDDFGPNGANDIITDPKFVGSGDYHIFSTNDSYHGGEWPPTTATAGTWTSDASDSPALDTGNPADSYANEPASGGRINQGAYGNTVQASKTVSCTYPTTQASNYSGTPAINSINISWTRGNGNAVLVVARQGSAVNQDPSDGTTYMANAAFGSGTPIGTGNYVVYDGTGTSVNVTGLTASTTYYFALYEYNSTGYCYLIPELTGNSTTTAPPTYNWTGATNTNWFTTTNWSSGLIPSSSDDVTIPNGQANYPVINNGIGNIAVCNNITIESSASVTVDPDGYMTVSGSITNNAGTSGLVINSDDTGTGSLIQNTSGGVDATVNCRLASTSRQWHMVSSPVTAAALTVFPSTSNLYYYDESTADYWTGTSYDAGSTIGWLAPSGNMGVAQGYAYNYFATTLTYTGLLNDNTSTSSINIPYTNHGVNAPNGASYDDFDGWVFIGNPYTSAIDWDNPAVAHAAANLNDAIYTYDDATLHNYTSYVGGVGTNRGTQYIPAMQGFFVKGDASETGGTLNIGAAARVHNAQGYWKTTYETPENFLRLKISGNGYTDETVLRMLDGASNEMDNGMDAFKFFTWNENVPQIYTNTTSSTDYSINTINTVTKGSVSIPLKTLQTGENYSIQITEFNFNGINVFLKDNLYNETVEIGLNDILNFVSDETDDENRFEIIFEKSNSSITQAMNSSVKLYPNPAKGTFFLTIGNNVTEYNVSISNITGQVVYENSFNDEFTKEINLNTQAKGIYFVKIKFSDKSVVNKKIVIE